MQEEFIKIESTAIDLLKKERPELTKLYVLIKRKMDVNTGIAGIGHLRISQDYLSKAFSWEAKSGRSKSPPVTRQAVRNGIIQLEKLGLIKRLESCVFELCLETAGIF